jgi:hypothetical protein
MLGFSQPPIIFRDILELEKQEKLADIVDVIVATPDGKAGIITSGYLEIGKLVPCGDLTFTKDNLQIGRGGWKVRDDLTLRGGVTGREDVDTLPPT